MEERTRKELKRRRNRRMDELAWDFNRSVNPMDVVDKLSDLLPQTAQEQIKCKLDTNGKTAANRELSSQIRYRKNWYVRLVEVLKEEDNLDDLVEKLSSDEQGSLIGDVPAIAPQVKPNLGPNQDFHRKVELKTDDGPVRKTQRVTPNNGPSHDYVKQAEQEQKQEYSKHQPSLAGRTLQSQEEPVPGAQRSAVHDRRVEDEDEKRDQEKPSAFDEEKNTETREVDDACSSTVVHSNGDHDMDRDKNGYSKGTAWNQSQVNIKLKTDDRAGNQEKDRDGKNPRKLLCGDELMNNTQPISSSVICINGSGGIPLSESGKENETDDIGGGHSNVLDTPFSNHGATPEKDACINCSLEDTRGVIEDCKMDRNEMEVTQRRENYIPDEKEESCLNEVKHPTSLKMEASQVSERREPEIGHLDNHEASIEGQQRQLEDYLSDHAPEGFYSQATLPQQACLKELGLLNANGQRNVEEIEKLGKSSDVPYLPLKSSETISNLSSEQSVNFGNEAMGGDFKTPTLEISESFENSYVTKEESSSPEKNEGVSGGSSDLTPTEEEVDPKCRCARCPPGDGDLVINDQGASTEMEDSTSQPREDFNLERRVVERQEGVEGYVEGDQTEQFPVNPREDERPSDTSVEDGDDEKFKTVEQKGWKSIIEKFFSAVGYVAPYITQINTNEPVIPMK